MYLRIILNLWYISICINVRSYAFWQSNAIAAHVACYLLIIYWLQGEVLTTMSDDIPLQSLVHVLPTLESTDKMIHLMLTDKFFSTAITAATHSGVLHHKITPDQVKLSTCTCPYFAHITVW